MTLSDCSDMDTVGNAPYLCDGLTSSDQSKPDWSLTGQVRGRLRYLLTERYGSRYGRSPSPPIAPR
jgi:hypothetical protein